MWQIHTEAHCIHLGDKALFSGLIYFYVGFFSVFFSQCCCFFFRTIFLPVFQTNTPPEFREHLKPSHPFLCWELELMEAQSKSWIKLSLRHWEINSPAFKSRRWSSRKMKMGHVRGSGISHHRPTWSLTIIQNKTPRKTGLIKMHSRCSEPHLATVTCLFMVIRGEGVGGESPRGKLFNWGRVEDRIVPEMPPPQVSGVRLLFICSSEHPLHFMHLFDWSAELQLLLGNQVPFSALMHHIPNSFGSVSFGVCVQKCGERLPGF